MKSRLPLFLFCAWALSAPARADTVRLAGGGKVDGKVTQLTLKADGLTKVLPGEKLRSVRYEKGRCTVVTRDGAEHSGALAAVTIKCVAGVLTFEPKRVTSITLGALPTKPDPKADPPTKPDPAKGPAVGPPDQVPPKSTPLSAEQKEKLRGLLKANDALRDEYLKVAKGLLGAEKAAIKKKYVLKYQQMCELAKEKRSEYAKYATKDDLIKPQFSATGLGVGMTRTSTVVGNSRGAVALRELNAAEAGKMRLKKEVDAVKSVVSARYRLRRTRVYMAYDHIRAKLLAGKAVPEDVMKQVYEAAVKKVK